MTLKLSGPVGDLFKTKNKGNIPADVELIKTVMAKLGLFKENEKSNQVSQSFIEAIKVFQGICGLTKDGRIDPGGASLKKLDNLCTGKVIVVKLKRQVLDAYDNLGAVYHFDCASGDSDHPTPPGYYQIERMEKIYRSKQYDAQMNYAMFFHRGYAIHMSHAVGVTSVLRTWGFESLGSHGCVRLPEDDAATLFKWAQIQTYVIILPKN